MGKELWRPAETARAVVRTTVSGRGTQVTLASWEAAITFKDRQGADLGVKIVRGHEEGATANRMQIAAVNGGLQAIGPEPIDVMIRTRSEYLLENFPRLSRWRLQGWRKQDGTEYANRDLWEELERLSRLHEVRVYPEI